MLPLPNVAPALREPVFALVFFWLATALGYRITRITRVPLEYLTTAERGLVCAALGAGCLQYVPLALGAFGLLSVWPVRVAMLTIVVPLIPDFVRVARSMWRAVTALRRAPRPSPAVAWTIGLALLLAILFVHALVIGKFGDDDGYHLTAPKRWLEAGSLVYLPTYGHTNAPMGFEALYAIALAVWGPVAAKMMHFGAGILCLLGLWLTGRRLAGGWAGVYAISLLLVPNPLYDFSFLFAQAYIELAVCWMTITCVLLFVAWREHGDLRLLLGAGACAGFAGTFKFPALCIGVALTLAVVLSERRRRVAWSTTLGLAARCGVLAAGPVLPWLFRNWRITGNPLFPMFARLIPTRDWSPEQGPIFSRYFRYYNWAQHGFSGFSESQRKLLIVVAGIVILLMLVVALWRMPDSLVRDIVPFAFVPMLAWLGVTGLYFRFWLPGIIILWLVIGAEVARRCPERRWAEWAPVVGLALIFLSWVRGIAKEPSGFLADLRMDAGLSSEDVEYATDPFWQVWDYLNRETPKDAHVMFASFFTTFGPTSCGGAFWVDRHCYATDSHLQGYIRFGSWSEFLAGVAKAKISYVLISDNQPLASRYGFTFPAGLNEYPFCQRLVREYGTELRQYGHAHIYRLARLPGFSADGSP